MKRLTRRDFASLTLGALVMIGAGGLKNVHTDLADKDNNFEDIHVGFNEPVDFNGHVVTVLGYSVGRDVRNQYGKTSSAPTTGLWLAFRVKGENWASRQVMVGGGGVRYADGTMAERVINEGFLQQPYGVRELGFTLVEVNPARLEGAVLELFPYEIISGFRRRAVVDLGFDRATVERLKSTPADAVIDFDVLGHVVREGM